MTGFSMNPGDYWKEGSIWYGVAPNGMLCNLSKHQVTEHEDGTITVSPSIRVSGVRTQGGSDEWHGYLEAGVWRGC